MCKKSSSIYTEYYSTQYSCKRSIMSSMDIELPVQNAIMHYAEQGNNMKQTGYKCECTQLTQKMLIHLS